MLRRGAPRGRWSDRDYKCALLSSQHQLGDASVPSKRNDAHSLPRRSDSRASKKTPQRVTVTILK